MDLVRLACVKHAASVRPEPGSNSPTKICHLLQRLLLEVIDWSKERTVECLPLDTAI